MKNVIITGTSRGIGFELAQLFAKNEYNVLALSRNSQPLKNLNIKNITTISIDLSKENELKKIIDLGEYWENTTGHLIPLGGIIIKSLDSSEE